MYVILHDGMEKTEVSDTINKTILKEVSEGKIRVIRVGLIGCEELKFVGGGYNNIESYIWRPIKQKKIETLDIGKRIQILDGVQQ